MNTALTHNVQTWLNSDWTTSVRPHLKSLKTLLRCTPQSTPRCTESGSATIPGPNLRGDSVFRSMCLYEIHGTKRRDAHGTHLGVPFPVPV